MYIRNVKFTALWKQYLKEFPQIFFITNAPPFKKINFFPEISSFF